MTPIAGLKAPTEAGAPVCVGIDTAAGADAIGAVVWESDFNGFVSTMVSLVAAWLTWVLGVVSFVALASASVVVNKDVAFLHFKKAQDSFVIFTISALNPHKRLFAPTS